MHAVFDFHAGVGEGGDSEKRDVADDELWFVVFELSFKPFYLFFVDHSVEGVVFFMNGVQSDDSPSCKFLRPESGFHFEVIEGSSFSVQRGVVAGFPLFDVVVSEDAAVGDFEGLFDDLVPVLHLTGDLFWLDVVDGHEVVAAKDHEVDVFELGEGLGGSFGDDGVFGEVNIGQVGDSEGFRFWIFKVLSEGGGSGSGTECSEESSS